ncbi:fungal-specific transcription factor domain-containing protein [Xylogone sp. PMI_703]|nr:fungal-specific transcription factor domain-containing protein [Xylogone sp. PMI_703]
MYGEARKRQRTRSFTGCWTCRSRRVKCDENLPACHRCTQRGVHCEGYGVRLSWSRYAPDEADDNPEEHDAYKPSRRTFPHDGSSTVPRISSPELDSMLERLDDYPTRRPRVEAGLFSVFPIHGITRLEPEADAPEPNTATRSATSDISSIISNSPVPSFHTSANSANACEVVTPGLLLPNSPHPRIPGPESNVTKSSNTHPALKNQYCQPHPPRHLDVLSVPADQKRLIHHWLTFVSGKLVLLDEPHNPCRTMMLPMALKGLLSSSEESTADIVTFHGVCACSAYSLFELGGRKSEKDQQLALQHDQLAITHLRHNLAQADRHDDQSFAMAIMACIAVDAISGTPQRWRTHVAGGLAYLTKLRSRGVSKEISSAFHQHIVSMAILCDFDVPADLKTFLDDGESLEFSFPYYGASGSFLRAHDRMNTMATSETSYDAREIDLFELQLYLDFPAMTQSSPNKTHSAILHHVSKVFYYAGLVFFQRRVRRASSDAVQELVERGIEELEAIELLSKGSSGSMMMWPALVLGAECATPNLQDRMRVWFKSRRRLGFRNVIVMDELIHTLWAKRATGDSEVTWQDLIATNRFDVFRL